MADFKEVCRQWRRMCEAANESDGSCVELCKLAHNPFCGDLPKAIDKDIENAEAVIMEWAKEHPEPVYPTWYEWLKDNGLTFHDAETSWIGFTERIHHPIPADVAEKLGIAQKEG